MRCTAEILVATALLMAHCAGQQLYVPSGTVSIRGNSYGDVIQTSQADVAVLVVGSGTLKFKVDRVTHTGGGLDGIIENLLVVTPSSGVTPARVAIGPNPNVTKTLPPGRYLVSVVSRR